MKNLNVAIIAAALLVASPAIAQPGGGRGGDFQRMQRGQQLTEEQLDAVWTHEAKAVAHRLELADKTAEQVTEAYLAVRKDYQVAMEKSREEMMEEFRRMREEGGGGGFGGGDREGRRGGGAGGGGDDADRPRRERPEGGRGGGGFGGGGFGGGAFGGPMQELRDDHILRLDLELSQILSEDEQVEEAMKSLGTFNGGWDRMVHTLIGFELETKALHDALGATEKYVIETTFDRDSFGPDTDFQAVREKMEEARTKMNETMKTVLNEEQYQEFERSTDRRRGRRVRDDV